MRIVADHLRPQNSDAVTVAVTGHRFLANIDELLPAIDCVLDAVEARWPGLPLTVISALAEGSDRLVAGRALTRPGAKLIVPLPMPEKEYAQDFRQPGSWEEFLHLLGRAECVVRFPPASTRPMAYEAAGEWMLEQSDLLIALWDGQPAGGNGGTGNVVALARAKALPLAWIHAHNHKPGCENLSLATPQGLVTFENFDPQDQPIDSHFKQ
jgi:hypothetical protein